MNPISINHLSLADQMIQYAAWLVALVEITLACYILFLNPRHSSNRYVAFLLLWIGINTLASGQIIGVLSATNAFYPTVLLAMTIPTVIPLLILVTIILFKPAWFHTERTGLRRYRFIWWVAIGMFLLPILLVLIDILAKTRLYFTGLDPSTYNGGFVMTGEYTKGVLRIVIQILVYGASYLVLLGSLIYFSFIERSQSAQNRMLARLMLVGAIISGAVQAIFPSSWPRSLPGLIASTSFAIAYGYGGFQQMVSGRRMQRGNLRARLTGLVLAITAPVLIAVVVFITGQMKDTFSHEAANLLVFANRTLKAEVSLWVETNTQILQNLARQPEIRSMQPSLQKPLIETTFLSFPYMDLVSTIDLQGQTVVRSDGQPAEYYADQEWFQLTSRGMIVDFQLVVNKASVSTPNSSLIVSVPILDEVDEVVGVLMFSTPLDRISEYLLSNISSTQPGSAVTSNIVAAQVTVFLVDGQGQVIAHSDKTYRASIVDSSSFAPVAALRQGEEDLLINYIGEDGKAGLAYIDRISNGWGVVSQVSESAALAPLQSLQRVSGAVLIVGMILLCGLVWLTIRQGLQPVKMLTEAASGIAAGDLNRIVSIESQDELGLLAQNFNRMTTQLRDLIVSLEQRVNDRTRDLTRRSTHLEAAAQVARQAAAISDVQSVMNQTTVLISHYFGYYHSGIFLIDNAREYVVLQAANSEGGGRMISNNHRFRVDQTSIVGLVADTGQPRIALDIGVDAVSFNYLDLPRTRSELAVPLMIRDMVIGVLDVQSTEPSAFTNEDINILQILADQIALAVNNARLVKDYQDTLQELQVFYGQQTRQDWIERLRGKERSQGIAFRYDTIGVKPEKESSPAMEDRQGPRMETPIMLRGQVLGSLSLIRNPDQPAWTGDESKLVEELVSHVVPALENARLLEQIQLRVQFERAISQLSSHVQSSLDLQTVMRTAIEDIGNFIHADKIEIRLSSEDSLSSDAIFQLPLKVRGKIIGILYIWPRQGENLSRSEIDFLTALQDRLAQAIESARLFQEMQMVAHREQYLNQFVTRLSQSLDVDSLLKSAVRELGRMQGVNDISIHLGLQSSADGSSGNNGDMQ